MASECRIPVAYVNGNVICVFMTEEELRENVRSKPIEGIDPDANINDFLKGYNKYVKEVVLKDYFLDIAKEK